MEWNRKADLVIWTPAPLNKPKKQFDIYLNCTIQSGGEIVDYHPKDEKMRRSMYISLHTENGLESRECWKSGLEMRLA